MWNGLQPGGDRRSKIGASAVGGGMWDTRNRLFDLAHFDWYTMTKSYELIYTLIQRIIQTSKSLARCVAA